MEDRTGKPVRKEEVDEALAVVRKFIVSGLTTFPPEFAVQLPNIMRCLQELRSIKPND
jgi:hypothetical protein